MDINRTRIDEVSQNTNRERLLFLIFFIKIIMGLPQIFKGASNSKRIGY